MEEATTWGIWKTNRFELGTYWTHWVVKRTPDEDIPGQTETYMIMTFPSQQEAQTYMQNAGIKDAEPRIIEL